MTAYEEWEQEKRLQRLLRMLDDMAAFEEAAILEGMTESLAETETQTVNGVPAPLSWHPYYRGKPWLIDWLNDTDTGLPRDHIRIPVPISAHKRWDPEPPSPNGPPSAPMLNTLTLTKHRAWGPAPYVGRPFVYVWNYAEDELGRRLAGESHIVYS